MDNANLTNDLRIRAESSIIEAPYCLTGFFKQLNCFQPDISSMKTINKLKHHMINLQEEVDFDDIHTDTVSGWADVEYYTDV